MPTFHQPFASLIKQLILYRFYNKKEYKNKGKKSGQEQDYRSTYIDLILLKGR